MYLNNVYLIEINQNFEKNFQYVYQIYLYLLMFDLYVKVFYNNYIMMVNVQ